MIEKICPLVTAALELIGIPAGIACAVANLIPRMVTNAQTIADRGGDPEAELAVMLDAVEARELDKAEKAGLL